MSGAGAVRVGPRPGRIALAAAGGAWALVSLPLTAADWGAPWVGQLSRIDPWRSVRAAVDEPYILFGALAGLSFLAIGLALLPSLWRGGWGGRVLAALVLAGAVVTPASYLSTPEESPLHALWGSEGPLLVLVGLAGIAAAFTARGWPTWLRVLLGATLPVLIAACSRPATTRTAASSRSRSRRSSSSPQRRPRACPTDGAGHLRPALRGPMRPGQTSSADQQRLRR